MYTSEKNVKLNIYVNIFQQYQMGVTAGPSLGDTRISNLSQIYEIRNI